MAVIGRMPGTRSRVMSENLGSPAAADTDAVLAAVTDDGEEQVVTTGITQPDVPRVISATAGGTAGDIAAVSVTVAGTNMYGEAIEETLPAFDADTAGTKTGTKAFATVTSVTIPAHSGTGATTAIGVGNTLGLPVKLNRDTIVNAYRNGSRESTRPTVAFSATAVESNTVLLNSAPNGTPIVVDYYT